MDRTARIVGVWIVGCMIVGGSLVIANIPLAEPWTDQQILLVRLGLATIGLGVLGMVGEFLVAMRAWRGRRPEPTPLDVTPEILCGYFQTHTEVQARALAAPYMGQPIRVTGVIRDVIIQPYVRMVSFGTTSVGGIHNMAKFGRKWKPELSRLRRGQEVSVIGKINEVGPYTFVLVDSRLVEPPT